MIIKLNSDVIINTNYITAIEPCDYGIANNHGNTVKYILHTVDGHQWCMTKEDYNKINQCI